ncbi:MAG: hypothetical protein ACPG49_13040 [Chitinophagales bacterium]
MKLQNLLKEELWLKIEGNVLKIEEEGNSLGDKRLKTVTINDLPDNVFAFTTDKVLNLSEGKVRKIRNQFLSDNEKGNIHKNCDAVIIQYKDNELKVMLCELKSYSPTGYEAQLVNTKLFVEYLLSLYNTFKEENDPELTMTDVWYVIFYLKTPQSMDKDMRGKTKMHRIEKKKMGIFPSKEITKCAFFKPQHNYVKWAELTI